MLNQASQYLVLFQDTGRGLQNVNVANDPVTAGPLARSTTTKLNCENAFLVSCQLVAGRLVECVLAVCLATSGVLLNGNSIAIAESPTDDVDYHGSIRHVWQERCFACHGALKQEAGLRLDTAAFAIQGGDSGAAIVPGDADASVLWHRISSPDPDVRMPPEGEALKPEELDAVRRWINLGAKAPADEKPETDPREHWSFRPPVRIDVPTVDVSWARNPIDAFIAQSHSEHGLKAQPEADRRVWLRRVTLDLIGLPPTESETSAFLADSSDEAFETVVGRLLESPLYSERWARHWMDIWRYSDWWGLGAEVRNSQKHIWHWRDWIVESVHDDKPYDQMLREMLAADELYPNDLNRLRASGYLARQYFKFNRTSWLDETVEHTSKSMMGLTLNCCKCHDHKYDPLSQMEYYQMRAIFEPYQVRTDFVPGSVDVEQNGIPRAFDCHPDVRTFVHLRGDEKNPDPDQPVEPNVPSFLQFHPLEIQTVQLPAEAHQPGLRDFVLETHLKQAEARIADAQTAVQKAQATLEKLAVAAKNSASPPQAPSAEDKTHETMIASDNFQVEQPQLWEQRGGEWIYRDGKLIQSQVGATQRSLRLKKPIPRDFQATLKYTPTGGEIWKSVGMTFDVVDDKHNATVYLSSYANGPKVQVAYRNGGDSVYPGDGAVARQIELNQSHELTIKVRDTLINVIVDGQAALAYRLPIARRDGLLELMTFDVAVALESFAVRELTTADSMTEALSSPAENGEPKTLEEAKFLLAAVEKKLAADQHLPSSLRIRHLAERMRLTQPDQPATNTLVSKAVRAERLHNIAGMEARIAELELSLFRGPADTKQADKERLAAETTALQNAVAQLDSPGVEFTPLVGAIKTLENNLETEDSRRKPFPSISTGRRTAFAQWLTHRNNPLTARVAVNHLWNRHFGKGIVSTVFDFGRKGAPPTHPELLDWLAVELMDNGWSMKHIHRLVVLSGTYRMTSSTANADAANLQADGDNRYYWRRNPVRMEAQVVRDSLLYLAEELDLTRGGPSIPVADEKSRRRSLYYVHSHNEHQKFLSMFDDAGVLECYRRAESIVPQQALALENSELAATMSRKIAARLSTPENADDDRAFIVSAFRTVLNLPPTSEEISVCEQALSDFRSIAEDPSETITLSRIRLIMALLNHNDFVTIR